MQGEPDHTVLSQSDPSVSVELVRRSDQWSESDIAGADLVAAAEAAFAETGSTLGGEVALVLSDDAEIRTLNRTWANKDRATDVLSFPAERSPGDPDATLGDIVLAYETVSRDARSLGISLAHHTSHLVIHGMLHLLGYDHDTDEDAAVMERLESKVLNRLGLHDPYEAGTSRTN